MNLAMKIADFTLKEGCFIQRNRYMVGESKRVIAVYDGRGGTLFTMRYAIHCQSVSTFKRPAECVTRALLMQNRQRSTTSSRWHGR